MQAVGRVIRTDEDRGTVMLIDERYLEPTYLALFPYEWQHAKFIKIKKQQVYLLFFKYIWD